ncbi:cell wall assembly regulator SMI1 [Kribbella aluminosa]|uniref:Cell wall assembly regulator SMI1 n=1 Tax=Kribbella aluminosa TaxID=416017 RepID=A0ABS4UUF0_9ACTN|nr:SMI1/KNR4 family protein [Kribbella aluminosa]MBP2355262.1 cell wall assembly regulator SMI1 [Kribbella aluminosa]
MSRPVAESWHSIVAWLEQHLPPALEHLQPPASMGEISALRTAMDRRLPSDLIAWLLMNNGFGRRAAFGNLIPVLYTPMGIDRMLRDREMLCRIYSEWDRPAETQPAGSRSSEWLDGFLPIGDAGTDSHLLVDLRQGDLHGSVGTFDAEGGGFDGPKWFTISEMYADVADSLAHNQPALQAHAYRTHAATQSHIPTPRLDALHRRNLPPLDPRRTLSGSLRAARTRRPRRTRHHPSRWSSPRSGRTATQACQPEQPENRGRTRRPWRALERRKVAAPNSVYAIISNVLLSSRQHAAPGQPSSRPYEHACADRHHLRGLQRAPVLRQEIS